MMERIRQHLGKLGQVGVGTMIAGGAFWVLQEILPYTGYYISQSLARVLFWVAIVIALVGIVLTIIALVRHERNVSEAEPRIDDLGKVVSRILSKIHQRDLKLRNAARKQYLALFGLEDYKELWHNYAVTQNEEAYESIKKELGRKKLKKDKTKRRKQLDDLQQRVTPIIWQEGWTLEAGIRLASFLEQFPKTQNGRYQGLGKRRESDRKWQGLFRSLNNLRLEHTEVFADKELAQMITEYFDNSKVCANLTMLIEVIEKLVPSDLMSTEYLVSGVEDANVKMGNRMAELLEDISEKIRGSERQLQL